MAGAAAGSMIRAGSCILLAALVATPLPARAAGRFTFERAFRNPDAGEEFGRSVAALGSRLLVGAINHVGAPYAGAAYLHDADSGALRTRFKDPAPALFGYFGRAVVAAGGRFVVGAGHATTAGAGSVFVFDHAGTYERTIASPAPDLTGFGSALAPAGDAVLVGGFAGRVDLVDVHTGAVRHTFFDPDPDSAGGFGASGLARAGDRVAVAAADAANGRGVVHVFDVATGGLVRTVDNPSADLGEKFGHAIAALGDDFVVGAPSTFGAVRPGAAYVVDGRTGDVRLAIPNPTPAPTRREWFGYAVATLGQDILVGAPRDDTAAPIAGAAYLVSRDSGVVRATFLAPAPFQGEFFGSALTAVGGDVLIGAGPRGLPGSAHLYRATCGNGVLDACETCDDGNTTPGDGCDASCLGERCGDGVVDAGEACDDGNRVDGDGCDTSCTPTGCGNCVVTGGEQCDDGGAADGDGCDGNCMLTACGNGVVTGVEGCDDGNGLGGDGCALDCKREQCGDGVLDAGESCDDGGTDGGDGCAADCRLETTKLDWFSPARSIGSLATGVENRMGRILVQRGPECVAGIPSEEAGSVEVFDPATGANRLVLQAPLPIELDRFGDAVAVADGVIAAGAYASSSTHGGGRVVHVFDAATGAFRRTIRPPEPSATFAFSLAGFGPDLLASSATGAHLVDGATGAIRARFPDPTPDTVESALGVVAAGTDVLLDEADEGAIHVYAGSGAVLRHTIRLPAGERFAGRPLPRPDGTFLVGGAGRAWIFDPVSGSLVRTLSLPPGFDRPLAWRGDDLIVRGPGCGRNDDDLYAVFLVDGTSGRPRARLCNPDVFVDFGDEFGAAALAIGDRLVVGHPVQNANGSVDVFEPCTDGILVPGEECDDGDTVDGDGCDRNCTRTSCGNGIVTAAERCDDGNRLPGDGCEPDCTPTAACADGARVERARATLRRLGGPGGDETLVVQATLRFPDGVPAGFSPATTGAQIRLDDLGRGQPLLDLTSHTSPIPPGGPGSGCGVRDGWQTSRGGAGQDYRNRSGALDPPACTDGSASGLRLLRVRRRRDGRRVDLRAVVSGATLAPPQGPLRLLVVAGPGRACAEHAFAPSDCAPAGHGATFRCGGPPAEGQGVR